MEDVELSINKLDKLSGTYIKNLRLLKKKLKDAHDNRDNAQIVKSIDDYDQQLTMYICVLMTMCKIYWDRQHYVAIEKLFRQSAEFCNKDQIWCLNVAHNFYMQDKYEEALEYYLPIMNKHLDNLLNVTAIVLANICVCYIMSNQV